MRDGTPVTLYCFAHAGAGVSGFAHWRTATGPGVTPRPVLLPGRNARRGETPATTRQELLDALLDPLADQVADGRPYVLYGHSLGGIVAYTLAGALIDRGLPAPHSRRRREPPPHTSPLGDGDTVTDERLLRFVTDLGAAPGGALATPGSIWYRTVLPPAARRPRTRRRPAHRRAHGPHTRTAAGARPGRRRPGRPRRPGHGAGRLGALDHPPVRPAHRPRRPLLRPRSARTTTDRARLPCGAAHPARTWAHIWRTTVRDNR